MIRIIHDEDMRPADMITREIREDETVGRAVDAILADVRARGDMAVIEYEAKFDRARIDSLRVPDIEIEAAYRALDPDFRETLEIAARNIRAFHRRQARDNFVVNDRPGRMLGQRVLPLQRVGLYVPGGTASYPSTVLMNAIPAAIAGVPEIVMATPPAPNGAVAPTILAAAKIAGVTEVYRMGGAQAIAAMAYGTESVAKVDKVTGPGNIYVQAAKKRAYGMVAIDMIAGPSEILLLADGASDPRHIAADMLSQAEHDRLATAILVTDSASLALSVAEELERQIPLLDRAAIARDSIDLNGKIVLVDTLDRGVEIANILAPEHLEIMTDDPFMYLNQVRNAGSVFLGRYAPEALGDYFAGPNHTLPTSGTARFSSPLSVDDFVKKSSFVYYTKDALGEEQARIRDFAMREGLQAHAKSVTARFGEE